MTPQRKKQAVAWLSVASNSLLVVGKIVVGVLTGSVSVISEAIHSGVDLVASLIAVYAVRQSAKPADERHPFGHGKFENISGTVEALLIFLAAAWILWEAIERLASPRHIEAGFGVGIMLFSALANTAVSALLFRVGKETDSVALRADAWHLRTDVWTSAGVMAGLGLIWGGDWIIAALPNLAEAQREYWRNRLHVLDPLAAIIVALLIVRAAWRLTVQSARDLMDVTLPPEEEEWIRRALAGFAPAVHGFHRMRTRKAGADRFVDFHIFVDAQTTVLASHQLAHRITGRIKEHFGPMSVIVHVEPCAGQCPACTAKCVLTDAQRKGFRDREKEGEEPQD